MSENRFERKKKEDRPVLAICYDFDKTLSPDDMQAQGYIQKLGYEVVSEFWNESNKMAVDNEMDQNLAYMYKMVLESEGKIIFNREMLRDYGSKVKLYKGVDNWFERIRKYGEYRGVIVEHYIISSGLKEMIEGTSVADEFEMIYASSFYYSNSGVAKWPAQVVNYTNKTQFLFRIEKGVLDINDDGVNEYFKPEEIRIPFRNIVYIGDSDTDIPCMKLVNTYGGHSIGVYDAENCNMTKVYKMLGDNRIKYYAPTDYTENSKLDKLVKHIVDKTLEYEKLESVHYADLNAFLEFNSGNTEDEKRKQSLMIALEESSSYKNTHTIVAQMSEITSWNSDECKAILRMGVKNSQIKQILRDSDIRLFYKRCMTNVDESDEYFKAVADILSEKRDK